MAIKLLLPFLLAALGFSIATQTPALAKNHKATSTKRTVKKQKEEPPVNDQALKKRLRVMKIYKTSQPETLESLAHLLYGHRTWAPKIKKLNPKLAKLKARSPVKKGTRVYFLAPKIGQEYVVQKNDWLIRIAIWKYGDTEVWKDIYEKNVRKISNPNRIRPGDKIYLGKRGGIQVSKARHPEKKQVLIAEPEKAPIEKPQVETEDIPVVAPSLSPSASPSPAPSLTPVLTPSPSPTIVPPPPAPSRKGMWLWILLIVGIAGGALAIARKQFKAPDSSAGPENEQD